MKRRTVLLDLRRQRREHLTVTELAMIRAGRVANVHGNRPVDMRPPDPLDPPTT